MPASSQSEKPPPTRVNGADDMIPVSDQSAVRAVAQSDYWIALSIGLVAAALFYPFVSLGIDPLHDGVMLKPAMDVASGQALFRDTFSHFGPLTTWIQAAGLLLFDPSLLTLRYITLVAYVTILPSLYLCWREFLPRSLAIAACGLFLVQIPFYHRDSYMLPWSSSLALLFQVLSGMALLKLIMRSPGSSSWAYILGFALAATFWCRQSVGGLLMGAVAAIGLALWWVGWRKGDGNTLRMWSQVLLGCLVPSALVIGVFIIQDSVGAWWEQDFEHPKKWLATEGARRFAYWGSECFQYYNIIRLAAVLALGSTPLIVRAWKPKVPVWIVPATWAVMATFYIVNNLNGGGGHEMFLVHTGGWTALWAQALIAGTLWCLIKAGLRLEGTPRVEFCAPAAWLVISLASLLQYYPVPSVSHVFWALAPSFGILVYGIWKLTSSSTPLTLLGLALVYSPAVYDKILMAGETLALPRTTLASPAFLRGMKVEATKATAFRQVEEVTTRIRAQFPGVAGMVYGDDVLWALYADRLENPGPYYLSWIGLLEDKDRKQRLNYLYSKRPIVFLSGAVYSNPKRMDGLILPDGYTEVAVIDDFGFKVFAPGKVPVVPK